MPALREEWRVPGLFIRDLLATGQYGPAGAHRLYRRAIQDFNNSRPRAQVVRGMRYASMVRYFRLLEDLGAIERIGTAPVNPLFPHLRRPQAAGEPAVQVLYRPTAPPDSDVWVKPWSVARGVLGGVQPSRQPRATPQPAPRPVAGTPEPDREAEVTQIADAWQALTERLEGYRKPNRARARDLIEAFLEDDEGTRRVLTRQDLEPLVEDVMGFLDTLDEETELPPDDRSEEPEDIWHDLTTAMREVDFSPLERDEES